jgi:hypothetical protein
MKRFVMILLAAGTLIGGVGLASAQGHGHGGGAGVAHSGGSWNNGGNWNGGNWRGGNWNGNWHGSHSRVFIGVGFGGWGWGWWPYAYPAYYPAYYSYPYYYDYPSYAYPYSDYSGGYVEQGGTPAPSQAPQQYSSPRQYSYYCPDPAGYYPQVPTCAKGWLRVVPSDAPGPASPAPR